MIKAKAKNIKIGCSYITNDLTVKFKITEIIYRNYNDDYIIIKCKIVNRDNTEYEITINNNSEYYYCLKFLR